jgi:hypothetical protein
MLSIRWREWEGNDRKNFVLFAKQETVQMWSYTTKPINGGWKEEDTVLVHGLEEAGLMITRLQFLLRRYPVDSSTCGVRKVGVLVSVRRGLCDGDINGNDLGWREKVSTLVTSDGDVSWADGGREGRMIEFDQVDYCVFTIMPGGHQRTIILLVLVLRSTLGYHGQVSVKLESQYENRYD